MRQLGFKQDCSPVVLHQVLPRGPSSQGSGGPQEVADTLPLPHHCLSSPRSRGKSWGRAPGYLAQKAGKIPSEDKIPSWATSSKKFLPQGVAPILHPPPLSHISLNQDKESHLEGFALKKGESGSQGSGSYCKGLSWGQKGKNQDLTISCGSLISHTFPSDTGKRERKISPGPVVMSPAKVSWRLS